MATTITATTSVVLAHQGGWDEALLIGGPIVAIVGLLWLAKRRVDAAAAGLGSSDSGSSDGAGTTASAGTTSPLDSD